jgi:5-phospho-D-xylono-1,4-lactonase
LHLFNPCTMEYKNGATKYYSKKMTRTVLGDIESTEMGLTYSHEHIVIEESFPTDGNVDFLLNDISKISSELAHLKKLGVSTMIDTMPANAGRNVLKLAEVSRNSGIQIVAPTGVHLEIYYPKHHWQFDYSEDQLSDLFIADVEKGIDRYDYNGPIVDRTEHKAGLVKFASGDEKFSKHQEKIFRAVVNCHRETGCPILTHTNNGLQALEQANLFAKLGADFNHVVLSHTDRNKDLVYQHDLMQTGVSVEYDSAFRWKAGNENWTYRLLEELLLNYPNQITAGMDAARNKYWKSYGGSPGLDYLLTTFKNELTRRGLIQFWDKIFYENPQRIFSFCEA